LGAGAQRVSRDDDRRRLEEFAALPVKNYDAFAAGNVTGTNRGLLALPWPPALPLPS